LESVKDELARLKNSNVKLEENLAKNSQEIKDKKDKILALNNEIDRLKKKNESDGSAAAQKRSKLQDDISEKVLEIDELEKREVLNNAKIKNLENELNGRGKASAQEVEDLKRKLEDAVQDLTKAKERDEKLRADNANAQKEISEKTQSVEELKLENKKIPGLTSNLKDLEIELDALRKNFETANSKISDLEANLVSKEE
jgi:chromosome segregation ATPase